MQCYHCGREVRETRHWQKTFAVDYYQLHTGITQWATFISAKPDVPPLRYLKLTHPVTIVTCAQCYGSSDIRQMLDDDFSERRSIVLAAIPGDSAPAGGSKG